MTLGCSAASVTGPAVSSPLAKACDYGAKKCAFLDEKWLQGEVLEHEKLKFGCFGGS